MITKKEIDHNFIRHTMPVIRLSENGIKNRQLRIYEYGIALNWYCKDGRLADDKVFNYTIPRWLIK